MHYTLRVKDNGDIHAYLVEIMEELKAKGLEVSLTKEEEIAMGEVANSSPPRTLISEEEWADSLSQTLGIMKGNPEETNEEIARKLKQRRRVRPKK